MAKKKNKNNPSAVPAKPVAGAASASAAPVLPQLSTKPARKQRSNNKKNQKRQNPSLAPTPAKPALKNAWTAAAATATATAAPKAAGTATGAALSTTIAHVSLIDHKTGPSAASTAILSAARAATTAATTAAAATPVAPAKSVWNSKRPAPAPSAHAYSGGSRRGGHSTAATGYNSHSSNYYDSSSANGNSGVNVSAAEFESVAKKIVKKLNADRKHVSYSQVLSQIGMQFDRDTHWIRDRVRSCEYLKRFQAAEREMNVLIQTRMAVMPFDTGYDMVEYLCDQLEVPNWNAFGIGPATEHLGLRSCFGVDWHVNTASTATATRASVSDDAGEADDHKMGSFFKIRTVDVIHSLLEFGRSKSRNSGKREKVDMKQFELHLAAQYQVKRFADLSVRLGSPAHYFKTSFAMERKVYSMDKRALDLYEKRTNDLLLSEAKEMWEKAESKLMADARKVIQSFIVRVTELQQQTKHAADDDNNATDETPNAPTAAVRRAMLDLRETLISAVRSRHLTTGTSAGMNKMDSTTQSILNDLSMARLVKPTEKAAKAAELMGEEARLIPTLMLKSQEDLRVLERKMSNALNNQRRPMSTAIDAVEARIKKLRSKSADNRTIATLLTWYLTSSGASGANSNNNALNLTQLSNGIDAATGNSADNKNERAVAAVVESNIRKAKMRLLSAQNDDAGLVLSSDNHHSVALSILVAAESDTIREFGAGGSSFESLGFGSFVSFVERNHLFPELTLIGSNSSNLPNVNDSVDKTSIVGTGSSSQSRAAGVNIVFPPPTPELSAAVHAFTEEFVRYRLSIPAVQARSHSHSQHTAQSLFASDTASSFRTALTTQFSGIVGFPAAPTAIDHWLSHVMGRVRLTVTALLGEVSKRIASTATEASTATTGTSSIVHVTALPLPSAFIATDATGATAIAPASGSSSSSTGPTAAEAESALLSAPYLVDITTATRWRERFMSQFGSISEFVTASVQSSVLSPLVSSKFVLLQCSGNGNGERLIGVLPPADRHVSASEIGEAFTAGDGQIAGLRCISLYLKSPLSFESLQPALIRSFRASGMTTTAAASAIMEMLTTLSSAVPELLAVLGPVLINSCRSAFARDARGFDRELLSYCAGVKSLALQATYVSALLAFATPAQSVEWTIDTIKSSIESAKKSVAMSVAAVQVPVPAVSAVSMSEVISASASSSGATSESVATKSRLSPIAAGTGTSTGVSSPVTGSDTKSETNVQSTPATVKSSESELESAARLHVLERQQFLKIDSKQDELRDALNESVSLLSHGVYNNVAHFIHELVQNGDDNNYPPGVNPEIRFILTAEDGFTQPDMIILNNETGFTADNITSLSRVGRSTKKRTDQSSGSTNEYYIGNKGIGFKSVFRVSSKPEVHSAGYHISFSDDPDSQTLRFIYPSWIESKDTVPEVKASIARGWSTVFRLPLRHTISVDALISEQNRLPPTFLLFLKKLRLVSFQYPTTEDVAIEVDDDTDDDANDSGDDSNRSSGTDADHTSSALDIKTDIMSDDMDSKSKPKSKALSHRRTKKSGAAGIETDYRTRVTSAVRSLKRTDSANGFTAISDGDQTVHWMVVRERLYPPDHIKRDQLTVKETEMALAFPLFPLGRPPEKQDVFAFLPVKTYGFRFAINADWVLPASRQDLDSSGAWNTQFLRKNIARLFAQATRQLVTLIDRDRSLFESERAAAVATAAAANSVNTSAESQVDIKSTSDDTDTDISAERTTGLKAAATALNCGPSRMHVSVMNRWYSLIPVHDELIEPFESVKNDIMDELQNVECVPTASGKWRAPPAVVCSGDETLRALITSEMLATHLGREWIDPVITYPPCSALIGLGVADFGIRELIALCQKLTVPNTGNSTPAVPDSEEKSILSSSSLSSSNHYHAFAARGFVWIAKFFELVQRYREMAKRGTDASITLAMFEPLKNLPIIPLSSGAWISANQITNATAMPIANPLFFPQLSLAESSPLGVTAKLLNIVSPQLWDAPSAGMNGLSPAEQGIIQSRLGSVTSILSELFGVVPITLSNVLLLHVVPAWKQIRKEPDRLLKLNQLTGPSALAVQREYRAYITLLFEYIRHERSGASVKRISMELKSDDLRELLIVPTSNRGLVRCTDIALHFLPDPIGTGIGDAGTGGPVSSPFPIAELAELNALLPHANIALAAVEHAPRANATDAATASNVAVDRDHKFDDLKPDHDTKTTTHISAIEPVVPISFGVLDFNYAIDSNAMKRLFVDWCGASDGLVVRRIKLPATSATAAIDDFVSVEFREIMRVVHHILTAADRESKLAGAKEKALAFMFQLIKHFDTTWNARYREYRNQMPSSAVAFSTPQQHQQQHTQSRLPIVPTSVVFSKNYPHQLMSQFAQDLISMEWMPAAATTDTSTRDRTRMSALFVPGKLFSFNINPRLPEGSGVPYAPISDPDFGGFLGVKSVLTLNTAIELLKRWSNQDANAQFKASVTRMAGLYVYLSSFDAAYAALTGDSTNRFIFLPPNDYPEDASHDVPCDGRFYSVSECVWGDRSWTVESAPTDALESVIGHPLRVVGRFYPLMKTTFTSLFGGFLAHYPDQATYIKIIRAVLLNRTPIEVLSESNVFDPVCRIFAMWSIPFVRPRSPGHESEETVDVRLFGSLKIFPTTTGECVSMSDQPIIIDSTGKDENSEVAKIAELIRSSRAKCNRDMKDDIGVSSDSDTKPLHLLYSRGHDFHVPVMEQEIQWGAERRRLDAVYKDVGIEPLYLYGCRFEPLSKAAVKHCRGTPLVATAAAADVDVRACNYDLDIIDRIVGYAQRYLYWTDRDWYVSAARDVKARLAKFRVCLTDDIAVSYVVRGHRFEVDADASTADAGADITTGTFWVRRKRNAGWSDVWNELAQVIFSGDRSTPSVGLRQKTLCDALLSYSSLLTAANDVKSGVNAVEKHLIDSKIGAFPPPQVQVQVQFDATIEPWQVIIDRKFATETGSDIDTKHDLDSDPSLARARVSEKLDITNVDADDDTDDKADQLRRERLEIMNQQIATSKLKSKQNEQNQSSVASASTVPPPSSVELRVAAPRIGTGTGNSAGSIGTGTGTSADTDANPAKTATNGNVMPSANGSTDLVPGSGAGSGANSAGSTNGSSAGSAGSSSSSGSGSGNGVGGGSGSGSASSRVNPYANANVSNLNGNEPDSKHADAAAAAVAAAASAAVLAAATATPIDRDSRLDVTKVDFSLLREWPTPLTAEQAHNQLLVGRWGEQFVYTFLQQTQMLNANAKVKEVKWMNETGESFYPYDLTVTVETDSEPEEKTSDNDSKDDSTRNPNARVIRTCTKFIEVKSTRERERRAFEIQPKELDFAYQLRENYIIYFVRGVAGAASASASASASISGKVEAPELLRIDNLQSHWDAGRAHVILQI